MSATGETDEVTVRVTVAIEVNRREVFHRSAETVALATEALEAASTELGIIVDCEVEDLIGQSR